MYGICADQVRFEAQTLAKFCRDRPGGNGTHHKIPIFQRSLWWARQGLNLRPHPCEGCALPLSYAPTL
jgi:hypothetical protein